MLLFIRVFPVDLEDDEELVYAANPCGLKNSRVMLSGAAETIATL
jgi:hypothetical protein